MLGLIQDRRVLLIAQRITQYELNLLSLDESQKQASYSADSQALGTPRKIQPSACLSRKIGIRIKPILRSHPKPAAKRARIPIRAYLLFPLGNVRGWLPV